LVLIKKRKRLIKNTVKTKVMTLVLSNKAPEIIIKKIKKVNPPKEKRYVKESVSKVFILGIKLLISSQTDSSANNENIMAIPC
jgi:hypothetical protein